MKLTQYQRDAFVAAVMDDVPPIDNERVKEDLQAALVKAMSPTARKLYRENPNALAKVYTCAVFSRREHRLVVGDADFAAVSAPWVKAVEDRKASRNNLEIAVKGCATLKQLQAMFPEFVRYMPTEAAPTKNLPALANVVTDLVALGWPKGGAK